MDDKLPPESPAELTAGIELVLCGNCGQPVIAGSRFCSSCGVALVPGETSALNPGVEDSGPITVIEPDLVAGLAPGEAVLVVRRGPEEGTRFELHGPVLTVGRAPDATIFLDDVTVSRKHATFTRSTDGWLLADAGSLNGTYVNKDRIDSYLLNSGDEVQIGKYRFLFFQVAAA